jgi:hypothetical protein
MRRAVWLIALLSALVAAQSAPRALEPRVHLLHATPGGDPMLVYYEAASSTAFKTVSIPGVPVRAWRFVTAFGKRSLEIELITKPGLNAEWDALSVTDPSGKVQRIPVGPSRVTTIQERDQYELSYERMEQEPNNRLFLGLRVFNDSDQIVTVDKFIYAPSQASAARVLVQPRYDSAWFQKLEDWVRAPSSPTLPAGATLMDANNMGLKILPSRGFSAAIVAQSFKREFTCPRAGVKRDPSKRVDSAVLQPFIVYRVGGGAQRYYPIPDTIIADVCP